MHKLSFLLILLLFMTTGCQASPAPTETRTEPTSLPTNESPVATEAPVTGGGVAPEPVLTRDGLNTVPPEDIIQEIGYLGGAGGGGGACFDVEQSGPAFWDVPQDPSELMQVLQTYVCNLQPGEPVEVRVEKPNGEIVQAQVSAEEQYSLPGFAVYEYVPLPDDPTGTYTFTFSGAAWSLEYTHTVIEPESARLYEYESNLYFLGFAPNERVRLLVYESIENMRALEMKSRFQGWTQFQMDPNGKRRVELNMDSADYVAIGEQSGEVNGVLAGPDRITEPFSVYCEGLAKPVGLVAFGYAEVLVDSLPSYTFNRSTGHWEKGKDFPIEKGSIVKIDSNTNCGEDSYLWSIACPGPACGYVIPESGPGGPYLRPVEAPPATSTPEPSEIPACPGSQPTRLRVGMNAEVTTSGMAPQLALRAQPSLNADKVHVIAAGRHMVILQGPVCADGSYWWNIRSEQGLEGWAREGDNEDYWIDPLP